MARLKSSTTRRMMSALLALVLSRQAVVVTSASCAEENPEDLINQGVRLRKQGHDPQAEGYFKRAYELAHTPRSAAQLALVELALGEYWRSEKHFADALSQDDAWIRSQKKVLEASRRNARKHLGQLNVSGVVDGLTLEISGPEGPSESLPVAAPASDVFLPEGEVKVRATAPSYQSASRTFNVSAGASLSWKLEMAPLAPSRTAINDKAEPAPMSAAPATPPEPSAPEPSPAPAPSAGSGRALRITGLALAGVGAGATVAGFVFRSMASRKLEHIRTSARDMVPYDLSDDNWKTFDNLGLGFIVGGLAAVVGGAGLYVFNRTGDEADSSPSANQTAVNITVGASWRDVVTLRGSF